MCNSEGMTTAAVRFDDVALELRDRLAERHALDDTDALLTARLAVQHYSRGQSRLQNIYAIREAVIDATGFPSRAARLAVVTDCVKVLDPTAP